MNKCRREVDVRSESVLEKSERMLVSRDEVHEMRREYFNELVGNDDERYVAFSTVGHLDYSFPFFLLDRLYQCVIPRWGKGLVYSQK